MRPLSARPVRTFLAAAVLLGLAGCADRVAEPPRVGGTFPAVDDGADVPGFAAFRDSLRAAVARRDTAALVATVAQGARLSFGDDAGGPEGFRAMWLAGAPPAGEPVWAVLDRLLDAGSVSEDGAVTVPYVFGAWPDSVDAFTHVAVVGDDVAARTAAHDTAAVAARLSHVILAVDGPAADGFVPVRLPGGGAAFVASASTMSPAGFRATFFPDDAGAWKLQMFLSGD